MATFKCKICGGTLEFKPGDTVAVCDSCGTKQTIPTFDGNERENLYVQENGDKREESANVAPLLKRVFLFLEDGNFDEADKYCERILDQEPENAQVYLGKLMVELRVRTREQLANCEQSFENQNYYRKIIRFGDDRIKKEIQGYITQIKARNENIRVNERYSRAVKEMSDAYTEEAYRAAADIFNTICGFKNAEALAKQCQDKAEECHKNTIYDVGRSQMSKETIESYEDAIETFVSISGWKDTDEQINACQKKIEQIKEREEEKSIEAGRQAEMARITAEREKRKHRKLLAIGIPVAILCLAVAALLAMVIIPGQRLNKAMDMLDDGDYDSAYALLEELGKVDVIDSSKYDRAMKYMEAGDIESAYLLLKGLSYKDSEDKLQEIKPKYKKTILSRAEAGDVVILGTYEQDNNASNGKEDIEWLVLAKDGNKLLLVSVKALDCKQYNSSRKYTTWEQCAIRSWLNESFLQEAFDTEEQAITSFSDISTDKNPNYNTNPGKSTTDRVFLLDIKEVSEYFDSDEARKCEPTAYAVTKAESNDEITACSWWLRSPGYKQWAAASVSDDGVIQFSGNCADDTGVCIRPAMWVTQQP